MISLEPLKINVLHKCKFLITNFHGGACSKDNLKIYQLSGRSYCQIWFCFNNIGSSVCLCIFKVYIFWGLSLDISISMKPFLVTLVGNTSCQPNCCSCYIYLPNTWLYEGISLSPTGFECLEKRDCDWFSFALSTTQHHHHRHHHHGHCRYHR